MLYKDVDFTRFIAFLQNIKEQDVYKEKASSSHNQIIASFINQISMLSPKESTVLDVGCGYGFALELFKKKGYKPVGITIGQEDYDVCKEKGFDVEIMDQSFLTFEENMFDLVWCRHCLEHSIMPFFTLSEFHRVSKKNAYLFVEVPLPDTCFDHQKNPNHYSVLGKSSWVSLIERTGYKILDSSEPDLRSTINPNEKDRFIAILAQKI
jgi:ubiquinone/menaquinone biosynthesis C-methylase UbiE